MDLGEPGEPQPLRREVGRQALGAAIGEHPLDLPLEPGRRLVNSPLSAAAMSASSGPAPHRKYDRRDASSRSCTRKLWPAATLSGTRSKRKMNSGRAMAVCAAVRMPSSKAPSSRPTAYICIRPSMSSLVGGRRKARRASVVTISVAQAVSSAAVAGVQVRMWRRLGVSDTPEGCIGPTMVRVCRCGSVVMPGCRPTLTSRIVCSTSRTESSTAPSALLTNAAATRCGPAVTAIGGVTSGPVLPS